MPDVHEESDEDLPVRRQMLYLPVSLWDFDLDALLDWGAGPSCLDISLWDQAGRIPLKPCMEKFVTAGGGMLKVLGSVVAPLVINGSVVPKRLFVVHGLQEKCILGLDFMCSVQAVLDIVGETISVRGQQCKLTVRSVEPNVCRI